MTDQFQEFASNEDIRRLMDTPEGEERLKNKAVEIMNGNLEEQSRAAHTTLQQEYAQKINNLRATGRDTHANLEALRDEYYKRGLQYPSSHNPSMTPEEMGRMGISSFARAASDLLQGDLASEYRQEINANRGSRDRVRLIQDKYRRMGLDVDHTPLIERL